MTAQFDVTAYGAVGNNSADDTAAIQAAINAAVAAGRGTVTFPRRGPWKVTDTLDVSASAGMLAIEGPTSLAQIIMHATTGKVLFNGVGSVFRTHNLAFKNLLITAPNGAGGTGPGNLAFDIKNKQETVWDNVQLYGYREGIKLEDSWAPLITNNCYFNGVLGRVCYAVDNSFNNARFINSTFAGNGLALNTPCIEAISCSNMEVAACDFSTNYTHILFDNVHGARISSYFENATLGTFEFANTAGNSAAIIIEGCAMHGAGDSVVKRVDGFTFINNNLFNLNMAYDATALRVFQHGNDLMGTATLGSPVSAATMPPAIFSNGVTGHTLTARQSFQARPAASSHGFASSVIGNANNVGYFEWYKPGPLRIAFMGYGTGVESLDLVLNEVDFKIAGGAVRTAPGTAAYPSLRIPAGAAPASPANGDLWFDGSKLKFRAGGVTKTLSWT